MSDLTFAQICALYDDPPISAVFVGGTAHGRQMIVPGDRDSYVIPVAQPVTLGSALAAGGEMTTAGFDLYRRIMIRDDGVRVDRHQPGESRRS